MRHRGRNDAVGAIEELVGGCGVLVAPDDPQALAEALDSLRDPAPNSARGPRPRVAADSRAAPGGERVLACSPGLGVMTGPRQHLPDRRCDHLGLVVHVRHRVEETGFQRSAGAASTSSTRRHSSGTSRLSMSRVRSVAPSRWNTSSVFRSYEIAMHGVPRHRAITAACNRVTKRSTSASTSPRKRGRGAWRSTRTRRATCSANRWRRPRSPPRCRRMHSRALPGTWR